MPIPVTNRSTPRWVADWAAEESSIAVAAATRGTKRPTPELRDDVARLFAAFGIDSRVTELTRSLNREE